MLRDPCVQASSARGISWSLFAHVLLHLWLWYATNSHIPVPPLQCHWFISNDSCCLIVRLFLGKMSNILPWYSSPLTHLTVRRWFQLFHGYLLFPFCSFTASSFSLSPVCFPMSLFLALLSSSPKSLLPCLSSFTHPNAGDGLQSYHIFTFFHLLNRFVVLYAPFSY